MTPLWLRLTETALEDSLLTLNRLNRLPRTTRDRPEVAALHERAEAGAAAVNEARRERHGAATQLADAEAAANGWEPARTLAIRVHPPHATALRCGPTTCSMVISRVRVSAAV